MLMRLLLLLAILFCFCCNYKQEKENEKVEASLEMDGKLLAENLCASCHLFPSPSALDKKSWQQVLPRMGYMLGIYEHDSIRKTLFEPGRAEQLVAAANIFPEKQVIKENEFNKIKQYYLDNAPQSLNTEEKKSLELSNTFKVTIPGYRLSPPSATLVKIDNQNLFLGDANKKSLFLFNQQLDLQQMAQLKEGIVDLDIIEENYMILMMGSFSPTDKPSGVLFSLHTKSNQGSGILIDQLQRPVDACWGDVNGDGLQDVVICEFGKWTGSLSLFLQKPTGAFYKKVLRRKPGAIKAYIEDMNGDNLPDIVALFGQGDEGIFLYENDGNGSFQEKILLRFPASYGSSYFKLQHLDQDEQIDILYTAGDNADFKPILKPYHGIRIFKNQSGKFEESFFYHMDGAYKAIAEDFDLDGDLDIAAISFFPDFSAAYPAGMVLLENINNQYYEPHSLPKIEMGRWIVMDAGDLDNDGDVDLALGSLAFEVVNDKQNHLKKWVSNGIPFIYLENTTRQFF